MFLHRRPHGVEALGEGGTAEAVKPGFPREHLHDDQPGSRRLRQDDLDVCDRHGFCHAAISPYGLSVDRVSADFVQPRFILGSCRDVSKHEAVLVVLSLDR